MTWHLGAHRTTVFFVLVALCVSACGSSGGRRAAIELIAPEDMAELTIEDDIDPDTNGVQIEIRARTQNIRSGTTMLLVMPGENTTFFTDVDDEGVVVFENATLPPGPHTFHIQNAIGSVSSKQFSYTLKTLVIETPRDGASIAFGDDTDPERDGLQVNVTVKAYAIDGNEDIELSVDGMTVGDPVSPNSSGTAVFRGVTLATGTHRLKAVAGKVESSEAVVDVNEACASVSFVSPDPGDDEELRLPGGDRCPGPDEDYVIDVVISTDAGDGREVELTVNNTTKLQANVEGSLARFENVVLNRRMTANEVSVTVMGVNGVTCASVPFPRDIFVDCAGSDCAIGSPVPFSGDGTDGEPVFYLNQSMLNGDGFDIRVDSDVGVLDQEIELIIDGRDGKNALRADTGPNGNRVSATFENVQLSAGAHTIEARCRDASGNTTLSGDLTWTVDVDACDADIEAPGADTTLLPADDLDSDPENGVQVGLRATVEGDDCIEGRAAVCIPDEGIADESVSFTALSDDSIEQNVTLRDEAEQALCVETKDRANNIGLASVTLQYRTEAPTVALESPADATVFNAMGNDDKTADSDPATPACNADFSVLCTELGGTVQLRHGDENGPMFASGTCEERADGDPELPAGFTGRAKLDDVAFLPSGQDNTSVIAIQVISGASHELVGKSEVISLTGWCESPAVTLFPGCPGEQLELPDSGDAEVALVQAVYNGTAALAPDTAQLTVTDPGGAVIYSDEADYASGSYRFTNVSLGDAEQRVETRIVLTDSYSNTTTITCQTTLVSDLPELQITSPSGGATLGPNDGCDPGTADKYGVPVTLALDQINDRELGYRVNDGDLVSVSVDDTDLNLCIPVDDGMSTIEFQLDSTLGEGVARPSIDIEADVLSIVEPAAGAVLLASDDFCDPDFGAHVLAEVAPAFEGSAVTVSSGSTEVTASVSGGQIDTCITLPVGASTLTVSLDDKSVSRSVDVAVVTESPTNSISLTGVALPDSTNYRSGQITLNWDAPTEDYAGQLRSYQLRCATTPIQASASDQDKDDWWSAARELPLAGSIMPPATSAAVGIRIGEQLNCVLRGADAADQLTPIPDSFVVSYPFREAKVDVADPGVQLGYAISSVGDVNDDNINDVLVAGVGRAYLYFGHAGGPSAKPNPTSPDVTFIGSGSSSGYEFGTRIASLGDINGDGEADFAIGHPSYTLTSPTTVGNAGATYLFYGRKRTDAWPSSVDLSSTNASECRADVCFVADTANEVLGFTVAAAGDFNGDGRADIAIGAPARSSLTGRLYVLLGRAFEGTGGTRASTFWNIGVRLPSGNPLGFYVDGTGPTGTDATASGQMGNGVASVGNVDGVTGADLIVNASGRGTLMPPISSKLYFLSGRAHNGAAPNLRSIAASGLTLLDSGPANAFAARLSPLRNWYDDTQVGIPDVAVFQSPADSFYVYLGDENGSGQRFATDTRITVTGVNGFSNGGLSASRGYNPNLSSVSRSDLDADGLDDLCIGTASGPGPIYVFYGSSVPDNLSSNQLTHTTASQINPSARSGATARTVQPVGDVTGDGEVDLVIGEPNANSNAGGITILY